MELAKRALNQAHFIKRSLARNSSSKHWCQEVGRAGWRVEKNWSSNPHHATKPIVDLCPAEPTNCEDKIRKEKHTCQVQVLTGKGRISVKWINMQLFWLFFLTFHFTTPCLWSIPFSTHLISKDHQRKLLCQKEWLFSLIASRKSANTLQGIKTREDSTKGCLHFLSQGAESQRERNH